MQAAAVYGYMALRTMRSERHAPVQVLQQHGTLQPNVRDDRQTQPSPASSQLTRSHSNPQSVQQTGASVPFL